MSREQEHLNKSSLNASVLTAKQNDSMERRNNYALPLLASKSSGWPFSQLVQRLVSVPAQGLLNQVHGSCYLQIGTRIQISNMFLCLFIFVPNNLAIKLLKMSMKTRKCLFPFSAVTQGKKIEPVAILWRTSLVICTVFHCKAFLRDSRIKCQGRVDCFGRKKIPVSSVKRTRTWALR